MAGIAIGWSSFIHSSNVTVRAKNRGMSAGQRKCGCAVVEGGGGPRCRTVTDGTIPWKACSIVIGIGGGVEIGKMARVACRRQACILSACMAGRALQNCVGSGERKPGRAAVEDSRTPCRRAVAEGTIRGETRLGVIGIRRPVGILQMTADASRRSAGKPASGVALNAIHDPVGPRQCKGRVGGVIKTLRPVVEAVTDLALCRKSRCYVIDGLGIAEISEMAKSAVGRESP
jgi:hypothetical protein